MVASESSPKALEWHYFDQCGYKKCTYSVPRGEKLHECKWNLHLRQARREYPVVEIHGAFLCRIWQRPHSLCNPHGAQPQRKPYPDAHPTHCHSLALASSSHHARSAQTPNLQNPNPLLFTPHPTTTISTPRFNHSRAQLQMRTDRAWETGTPAWIIDPVRNKSKLPMSTSAYLPGILDSQLAT
jgi:hypothetical protein